MSSTPAEIVISIADKVVGRTTLADNIATLHNSGAERFVIVNQWGQTIAALSTAVKILAPVSIQANTFAATVTFLKIVVEIKDGQWPPKAGDVLSLAGNVAGIVATVAILSGAAPVWVPVVATGIAVGTGAANIFIGDNFGKLVNWTGDMASSYWPTLPVATTTSDLYMDSMGNFRPYNEIPEDQFGSYRWDASSWGDQSAVIAVQRPRHQGGSDPWIDHPKRVIVMA